MLRHIVWQLLFLCTLTAKTARKAPIAIKNLYSQEAEAVVK